MKKNKILTSIILCSSVLLFSCRTNENRNEADTQTTELSVSEKEVAKKEISERIKEIIIGVKELNAEAALKPYSNDPDFKIVSPDASVTDFTKMTEVQTESFKSVKSMSFTTVKEEFKFLSKDLIMCTWTGNNEFELKTGEKMKIDPYVGSMLFRKKDNEWKIIYAHESSVQPVKVESKK
jgi:hypothetical protein